MATPQDIAVGWIVNAGGRGVARVHGPWHRQPRMTASLLTLLITATTPILIIPMAAYMDGDRPGIVTVLGSAIAVIGVILVLTAG